MGKCLEDLVTIGWHGLIALQKVCAKFSTSAMSEYAKQYIIEVKIVGVRLPGFIPRFHHLQAI